MPSFDQCPDLNGVSASGRYKCMRCYSSGPAIVAHLCGFFDTIEPARMPDCTLAEIG